MKKLHFSITINASRQKVWDTVIGETTYPQWTAEFGPGSHVQGDWSLGSKILFLAPNAAGETEGMVSMIAETRAPEFLSIKHLGYIKNGVEDTESPEVRTWMPAFENYTLNEVGNATEFIVDMETADNYVAMFEETWPKALMRLKEISEA